MPTEVINVVHTLANTDKAKKGICYNDDISAPNSYYEIAGVNTDKAVVQDNKHDNENDNDSFHEITGVQVIKMTPSK